MQGCDCTPADRLAGEWCLACYLREYYMVFGTLEQIEREEALVLARKRGI